MLLTCPQCQATYDQPEVLPGNLVQCTRCQRQWTAPVAHQALVFAAPTATPIPTLACPQCATRFVEPRLPGRSAVQCTACRHVWATRRRSERITFGTGPSPAPPLVIVVCPACERPFELHRTGDGTQVECGGCHHVWTPFQLEPSADPGRASVAPVAPGLTREVLSAAETARLFALVHASPADDGARLVLADHLTELGDPLGEFIAIQVSAAPGRPRGLARGREAELRQANHQRWLPRGVSEPRFERGLLHSCTWVGATDPAHLAWRSVEQLNCEGGPDRPFAESPFAVPARPALRQLSSVLDLTFSAMESCALPNLQHLGLRVELTSFLSRQGRMMSRLPRLETLHLADTRTRVVTPTEITAVHQLLAAFEGKLRRLRLTVRPELYPVLRAHRFAPGRTLVTELVGAGRDQVLTVL